MSKWMSRTKKLKQFKDRILEDLDVIADDGLIVHIKGGGSIDFTTMMDCYTRTRKFTLYNLMEKVHEEKNKITTEKLYKIVQKELTDIENEEDPT